MSSCREDIAIRQYLKGFFNRNPIPRGTTAIAWGLVVNGLATYGFLIVARRSLGEESYGGLAVLWGLVYILGPGLFQPLEQEVARATAERSSRGVGSGAVLRRSSVIGVVQFLIVSAIALAVWPLGLNGLLDNRPELLIFLLLSLAAFGGAELVRGVLSGRHLFERYGWYFGAEGGVRLLIGVVLALAGWAVVGAYAVAIAAAFAVAALVGMSGIGLLSDPGPSAKYSELTPALGWLLIASIGEAFMLNVGPVALDIVGGQELTPEAPGVFLNGLLIARVPLFFFQAVKASLLPNLATLSGRRDLRGFRDMQMRIVIAVSAAAIAATLTAAAIGPWIVQTVFGDNLGHLDMALLATGGGGLMIMLSLALGLVALGHTRLAVVGWIVSVLVFIVAIQFADEPFLRVETALVAAVVAGAVVTGILLRIEYSAHATGALQPELPFPTDVVPPH